MVALWGHVAWSHDWKGCRDVNIFFTFLLKIPNYHHFQWENAFVKSVNFSDIELTPVIPSRYIDFRCVLCARATVAISLYVSPILDLAQLLQAKRNGWACVSLNPRNVPGWQENSIGADSKSLLTAQPSHIWHKNYTQDIIYALCAIEPSCLHSLKDMKLLLSWNSDKFVYSYRLLNSKTHMPFLVFIGYQTYRKNEKKILEKSVLASLYYLSLTWAIYSQWLHSSAQQGPSSRSETNNIHC